MARKPKKTQKPIDHQQEHPNDPVYVPDLSKIGEIAKKVMNESAGGGGEPDHSLIFETICGTDDDSQPVESYDGTLGVTRNFVDTHEGPVGNIRWNSDLASKYTNPGTVSGVRWCTGTMISNDLFLTAGHCFDQTGGNWQRPRVNGTSNIISPQEIATNMTVDFNYQADQNGNPRTPTAYRVLELVEYRLGGLDFAIARLEGAPGAQWGIGKLSDDDGSVGDMMAIIGHPAGQRKRIEAGPITLFQGDRVRYNDIDTLGGTSGSGLVRESDGCIIGIHTNGGCNEAMTGSNFGVKITAIRRESPTIQGIRAYTNPIADNIKAPGTDTNTVADLQTTIATDVATSVIRDRFTTVWSDRATITWLDSGGTSPLLDHQGTFNKALDDRKSTGLDKQFSDRKLPGQDGLGRPFDRLRARRHVGVPVRPFVMSTPHHAPGLGGNIQASEANLAAYQEALAEIEAAIEETGNALADLETQYEALLAEAEAMFGPGG